MTRLIDADALNMYERLKSYYGDAWRDAQEEIDSAPTIDAVPVIRCKECRYFRPDDDCDQCALWEYGKTDREAFCSYAMRRGEG